MKPICLPVRSFTRGLLFAFVFVGGITIPLACRSVPVTEANVVTEAPISTQPPLIETPVVEEGPIPTLPPPLANVEFPTGEVEYLPEWPPELRYPEEFRVADVGSGTLPESDSTGWAAKLRYAGDPKSAAGLLSAFFIERGWQIAERTGLDSGGVLLVIQGANDGSGIIVIDVDTRNPGSTIIIATIFP